MPPGRALDDGRLTMDCVDEAAFLADAERTEGVRRVQAGLATRGAAACIGCGDDIEPERRAALPSARRCIECQGRVERRHRAGGRPISAVVGGSMTMTRRGG